MYSGYINPARNGGVFYCLGKMSGCLALNLMGLGMGQIYEKEKGPKVNT
jgi:hypothetical protein